jgi:putative heme-binding domain-containing protein
MRRLLFGTAVLPLLLVLARAHPEEKKDPYAAHVASTPPLAPADEAKKFELPPGFEVQLVAADPDIHKPLNIAFDDRGRLWVSETVEYPFPAPHDRKPRDAVKILEDFGPDGRARKITTFAGGLNIPIGVLPLPAHSPQDALIFSIPNIWRMSASKGAGQAEKRRVLYGTFGSKDTHGMTNAFTLGFDGWVYACHGFANDSELKASDGSSIKMNSGSTYRMRPDGSHIEAYTRGQVNPFGLCFDPLGNLYSCDCHSQPIYQLLRGGYYPSFGKPHDGLGFAPEMFTGYKGSTAISGIAYYAADAFPAAHRDTVFIGDVVTNQIVQFRLTWQGSTPQATQHDFLVSKDPWFRPVSIQLGPDGALYVADFYNRIIGHYEVPLTHPGRDRDRGRIWRIVYRGKDKKDKEGQGTPAPRKDWSQASAAELVADLNHPNLTVRMLATHQMVRHGKEGCVAVQAALEKASPWQWLHGLWVLHRLGALDEATLNKGAGHADCGVRTHTQHILAERDKLSPGEHKLMLAGLKDADANVQRAAADALGRHPAAENLRPLLDLRHAAPSADTHLFHVVRMALRDQLLEASMWARLPLDPWSERDGRAIADVALAVPRPEAAAYLLKNVKKHERREPLLDAVHHIARYGTPEVTGRLLEWVRKHEPKDIGFQAALFHAIEHGTQERGAALDPAVRAWAAELTGNLLADKNTGLVQTGIELVGALKLGEHQGRVAEVALSTTVAEGQRQAALSTLADLDARRHAAVLGKVLTDAHAPLSLREHAANLLARANQPETQQQMLQALQAVPARLQTIIAAGLAGSAQGADKLLQAVEAGKASARLLLDRGVALKLESAHQADLKKLKKRIEKLTEGLPAADQRIEELLRRRREGFLAARKNPRAGAEVFKKNCALCHQIAGEGARFGPQLDGIGLRGVDRLLEDILDPNRNVDQAFRQTALEMRKGQVVSGLLLKEEGAVLVLADAQGKEVRVNKADVAERNTTQMSPMPSNFAEQIPESDFYHLLAYLLEQRGKSDKPGGK